MFARALALAATLALAGCPGGVKAPSVTPEVPTLLDHLQREQEAAIAYKTNSEMEYWVNGERIKAEVVLIGKRGARIRLTAVSPAGGSTLAALACDGTGFQYVDDQNNCTLTGMCDATSIEQMLRIRLEPDDFLIMVAGTTPLIDTNDGAIEWNSKHGYWEVELISDNNQGTQVLHLSREPQQWDVLMSEMRDANGKVEWRVTNKDFKTYKGADGKTFRLPARTRLEQPKTKGDLTVRWFDEKNGIKREMNPPNNDPLLWEIPVPPALPSCK